MLCYCVSIKSPSKKERQTIYIVRAISILSLLQALHLYSSMQALPTITTAAFSGGGKNSFYRVRYGIVACILTSACCKLAFVSKYCIRNFPSPC